MQIFCPYPDVQKSVSSLDPKRLGNQIYRECLTLIRGGWPNHPCSKIWANHKHALALYSLAGLDELDKRGRHYPHHRVTFQEYLLSSPDTGFPSIWGNESFHASHRSNLLRKNPEWYSKFNWTETLDLDYIWVKSPWLLAKLLLDYPQVNKPYTFEFSLRDKVNIKEIKRPATVTGILIDGDGPIFKIAYWYDGCRKTDLVYAEEIEPQK